MASTGLHSYPASPVLRHATARVNFQGDRSGISSLADHLTRYMPTKHSGLKLSGWIRNEKLDVKITQWATGATAPPAF